MKATNIMKSLYVLIILCVYSLTSYSQAIDKKEIIEGEEKTDSEKVADDYSDVITYAFFQGCNDIKDLKERKSCSDNKLLQFVYKSLKYPSQARDLGVQGMGIVNFVIDSNGHIKEPKVISGLGYGTNEAMINVILEMQEKVKWEPAKNISDEATDMLFTLPMIFRLENAGQETYAFFKSKKFLGHYEGEIFINKEPSTIMDLANMNGKILRVNYKEKEGKLYITKETPD